MIIHTTIDTFGQLSGSVELYKITLKFIQTCKIVKMHNFLGRRHDLTWVMTHDVP